MESLVQGLHHVTAIAGDARRNFNFYTQVLGMRFVKRTVNFDDPTTYHFYYGNYQAEPGTIWTFFPHGSGIPQGRRGTGQATEAGFSVPAGSLDFWLSRLDAQGVIYSKPAEKFDETYLTLLDPDGLKLELTVMATPDARQGNPTAAIGAEHAIKGFSHVTLTLTDIAPTARVLTSVLGYQLRYEHVNRFRFMHPRAAQAIDLVAARGEGRGHVAAGSIHHVAFRVSTEADQLALRQQVEACGLAVTEVVDRSYFRSIYFREPGGVLFEIATDTPGFTVDEPLESLGTRLMLPPQYEAARPGIEALLPVLTD